MIHRRFAPKAAVVAPELSKLSCCVVVEDDSQELPPEGRAEYEEVISQSSAQSDFEPRSPDDRYIIYTGGTTGMPKGVMWRHEDIFFASLGGGDPDQTKGPIKEVAELAERLPEAQFATLAAPPFMHAAGQWMALLQMFSGGKLVIPAHGRFDVKKIWKAVGEEGVVVITVVGDAMSTPLMDELEAHPDEYDTSSLFLITSSGAILSPSVKKRIMRLLPGRVIFDGLGSSETGVMGNKASGVGDESDEPRFTVGEFVQVFDETLRPVRPGSGEIGRVARGGHVPLGYYNAPEKSAATFIEVDGHRWALPGDMATVEEDGSLLLLGRGSTSMNSGGEKVFPEEVESALKAHPQVYDAVVVGVPDKRWGQAVTAVYQTRTGVELDYEEIKKFWGSQIAAYKIPRHLVQCEKIKRSPAGKADYPWTNEFARNALGMS